MHRIWKFELQLAHEFSLNLPAGARLLDVQMQRGKPQLWALVDESKPLEKRRFRMLGTGTPVEFDSALAIYLGTIQTDDGMFVWHFFEERAGAPPIAR